MKSVLPLGFGFLAAAFACVSPAWSQATLTWSADGVTAGGSGTWNTTDFRWSSTGSAPFNLGWNNTTNASDTASFTGTAGTVTVDPSVTAVRRINISSNGYTIVGGNVTSNQIGNSFWLDSTANATVELGANFTVTGNTNIRIRLQNDNRTLNLGGNYIFADSSATKRLDLENNNNAHVQTINFYGSLLNNGGDTRLRIGNNSSQNTTFNISGVSTYTGVTEVIRGTVNLQNASGFSTNEIRFLGANTGFFARVNIDGAINISNAWQTAGISSFSVIGKHATDATESTLSGNINLNSDTNPLIFSIDNSGGRINVTGLITDGNGTRSITKNGSGTLNLARATGNSYDGGTIVNAGTLLVNNTSGSATGTGAVTLAAGATLGGNGIITGTVTTAATSVIAPGNSVGNLTLSGALDASAGAIFNFELGSNATPGVTHDLLTLGSFTGSTSSGGLQFNFSALSGFATSVPYTIITFTSVSGLDYSDLVASTLPSGYSLDTSFGTGGWNITSGALQVQFIPEPATWGLITAGLMMVLIFRRRRMAV